MKKGTYFAVINLKNNTATVYKDKTEAGLEVNCTAKAIREHIKRFGYYSKGDFRVYETQIVGSNRGNPMLNR